MSEYFHTLIVQLKILRHIGEVSANEYDGQKILASIFRGCYEEVYVQIQDLIK